MPQLQLPIFPEGMSLINQNLGFVKKYFSQFHLGGRK